MDPDAREIELDEEHEREAQPVELTAEEIERRDRALAQVRKFGDPVLRSRASEVTEFGPELRAEAQQMLELMRDALGVGLAATQLGRLRRLLVYQLGPEAEPVALVNPTVEEVAEETEVAVEGCLSLPGVAVEVARPLTVRVRARDLEGEPIEVLAHEHEARVISHEVDHLDGVLMLDRTEDEQRRGALRALREGETYSPPAPEPAEGEPGPEAVGEPSGEAPPAARSA